MITKITKDNEIDFFERGFKAINEALAKNGQPLEINSLDEYYKNLDVIKELPTEKGEQGKFLLVPFDEPFFEIDANARTITVPDAFKKNGVAVQGDHQAELLVFKVDRYFDYKDLFETKIAISWSFTPSNSRQETISGHDAAFAKTLYYDQMHVIFGFIITQNMTPSRGTLSFSVNFFNDYQSQEMGNSEEPFTYSLNTMIASVSVNEGLTLSNAEEVQPVNSSFLSHLRSSAGVAEGQAPIDDPEWTRNLNIKENFNGENPLILHARAFTLGANTDIAMKYSWNSSPQQNIENELLVEDRGQKNELTSPNKPTSIKDYFVTNDTTAVVNKKYYRGDQTAVTDIINGLSGEKAVEAFREATTNTNLKLYELGTHYEPKVAGVYYVDAYGYRETLSNIVNESSELIEDSGDLKIIAKKIQVIPENEISQENQNMAAIRQIGNNIFILCNPDLLNRFDLGNEQGSAKWVAIDLEIPEVDAIEGLILDEHTINSDDIAESNLLGLSDNHILYWVNVNAIQNSEQKYRDITIKKGNELETTIRIIVSNGKILTSTSNSIRSNTCTIPIAAKPSVTSVSASSTISTTFNIVESSDTNNYVYIDDNDNPEIRVTIESLDPNEKLKDVVAQIIPSSTTLNLISATQVSSLAYTSVTSGTSVTVTATLDSTSSLTEGKYKVYAINKENYTYNISSLDKEIQFSNIATNMAKHINVTGKVKKGEVVKKEVVLIENGEKSTPELEGSELGNVILEVSFSDTATCKYDNEGISCQIQEVDANGNNIENSNQFEYINDDKIFTQSTTGTNFVDGHFKIIVTTQYHNSEVVGETEEFYININTDNVTDDNVPDDNG